MCGSQDGAELRCLDAVGAALMRWALIYPWLLSATCTTSESVILDHVVPLDSTFPLLWPSVEF